VLGVKASPCAGLPVIVEARGPQETHVVALLTPDKQVGVRDAGVHAVRAVGQAPLLQRRVELGGGRPIGRRATHGFDMRDELRGIILTGFREVDFVAHPLGGILAGLVGVDVRGGADAWHRRRDIVRLAPAQPGAVPPGMLAPDPTQDGNRRDLSQPRGRVRVIDGGESLPAIVSNGQGEGGSCRWRGRKPVLRSPPRIAVPPGRMTHRMQPLGSCDGERLEGVAQGCTNHLEAIEGTHRGE
jgi:hypothetical protein